jgi:hypothetical protein
MLKGMSDKLDNQLFIFLVIAAGVSSKDTNRSRNAV